MTFYNAFSKFTTLVVDVASPYVMVESGVCSEFCEHPTSTPTASSVPAPLLVGVETNPGPSKALVSVPSNTQIVLRSADNKSKSRAQPKKKKNKNKKKKNNQMRMGIDTLGLATKQYVQTLDNPFSAAPVRLGFNTYLPTSLFTSKTSSFFTTTANPLGFMITTSQFNCWYSTTSDPASAPVYAPKTGQDYTVITASFDMGRVVSCGFRVYPLVAADSIPGVINTTQIGRPYDINALFGTTVNALKSANSTFLHPSGSAFELLWRPTDSKDYEFSHGFLDDGAAIVAGNYMFLSLEGYPVGTRVYVEHIVNYEGYKTSFTTNSYHAPQPIEKDSMALAVADDGISSESLFQRIMPYLSDNAGSIRDFLADVAFTAAQNYSSGRKLARPKKTQFQLM